MEQPTASLGAPVSLPDPALQAHWSLKVLVVLFTLSYTTFALWLLVDLWARDQAFVLCVLSVSREKLDPVFILALHTIVGALLGSGVLDLVSFHTYSAIKRDFQTSHVPGYFYGPWLAATVGLIVFCLLQSGLFVFSGGSQGTTSNENVVSRLGYISVGFLSGFGWSNAVEKIREIVTRFFAKDAPGTSRNREITDPGKANQLPPEGAGHSRTTPDQAPSVLGPDSSTTPEQAPPAVDDLNKLDQSHSAASTPDPK